MESLPDAKDAVGIAAENANNKVRNNWALRGDFDRAIEGLLANIDRPFISYAT